MVEKLLQLGPRDAMVTDLADGIMTDEKRSIAIGEDLLDKIKFIRAGEFDEKAGEPTLKLVGDVQAVDGAGSVLHKGFAILTDLIRDFLDGTSPYDPKDYVRCAVEVSNGAWIPMHFYGEKAGLNRKGDADFIHMTKAREKRKQTYADRALGKISPYQKAGGSALNSWRQSTRATSRNQIHRKPPPMLPVRLRDWKASRSCHWAIYCQCSVIAGKSSERKSRVGLGLSGKQLHGWMSCILRAAAAKSPLAISTWRIYGGRNLNSRLNYSNSVT